jgi:hypothetical protein
MTGFESKRQAAQAKLDDDADTLLIVYQRGFADGKQAAQSKPLTHEQAKVLVAKYGNDPLNLVFQTEAAHNIKEGT